jgi:hypothetical protein
MPGQPHSPTERPTSKPKSPIPTWPEAHNVKRKHVVANSLTTSHYHVNTHSWECETGRKHGLIGNTSVRVHYCAMCRMQGQNGCSMILDHCTLTCNCLPQMCIELSRSASAAGENALNLSAVHSGWTYESTGLKHSASRAHAPHESHPRLSLSRPPHQPPDRRLRFEQQRELGPDPTTADERVPELAPSRRDSEQARRDLGRSQRRAERLFRPQVAQRLCHLTPRAGGPGAPARPKSHYSLQ